MRKTLPALTIGLLIFSTILPARAEQTPTPAEQMIDLLPSDVLGFVATSGGDQLKSAFEQSSIGKIWNEPSVQTFYQQVKAAIPARMWIDAEDEKGTQAKTTTKTAKDKQAEAGKKLANDVLHLCKLILCRPVLIAVIENKSAPIAPIHGFLIVNAGDKKTAIADTIQKLEALDTEKKIAEITIGSAKLHTCKEKDSPSAIWGWAGNYFVLSVNDPQASIVHRLLAGPKPATQPANLTALAKLKKTDDALIMYADVQKIARLISTKIAEEKDGEANLAKARQAMQMLGLSDTQSFAMRTGFDGPNTISDAVLTIPQPHRGLLSLFKPVNPADLDIVPVGVIGAEICNVDFAGLYDLILSTIKTVAPEETPEIDKNIADFEQKAGFNIRKGILESIDGRIISYSLPSAALMGPMTGSGIMIVNLKDPALFEKTMAAVEKYVTANISELQMTAQTIDNKTYHFIMIPQLAMMQIAPVWTISKNQLIIATSMQLANTALTHATTQNAATTSIRSTAGFKQVAAGLPKNLISFKYVDQQLAGRQMMQAFQQIWPMAVMALQQKAQIKLPMMLPPADDIVKHLGPEVDYTWFDENGIRSSCRGAALSSSSGVAVVASAGLGTAILLPALSRAREMAKRSASASNLRQIYMDCYKYANDHNGQFPPALQDLKKYITNHDILESPRKPKGFTGLSYIYIPGQNADGDPRNVLMYENPAFSPDGLNVAYGDGHVNWVNQGEFIQELTETYKRLGKPMPKIDFGDGKIPATAPASQPASGSSHKGINFDKKIPFKCTNCSTTVPYTIRELQQMKKPDEMGPMMGPLILPCPKCHKDTLTQAVECPNCSEIFIMKVDPATGTFDDKCPKCHESYAKSWQKKYWKENGTD